MKTQVYILSSSSGGGKSTFANQLKALDPDNTIVVSADNYFMRDGEYKFRASELSMAHKQCQRLFVEALKSGAKTVVVDNTNTRKREYKYYIEKAESFGYSVTRLIIDWNVGNYNDVHGVPSEVKVNQRKSIIQSLEGK
jgi:predicted ABC-type ATPase